MAVQGIYQIMDRAGTSYLARLAAAFDDDRQIATGKTLSALRKEVTEKGFTISGPEHITALEEGRGPTKKAGSGQLLQRIKEWIAAKGLPLNPYAVSKVIHAKGTRLYRGEDPRFRKPTGLLLEPVPEVQEELRQELVWALYYHIITQIRKTIKNGH